MKKITLFHNPGAGDGDYSKEDLILLMKRRGYECRYLSTKDKEWKDFTWKADLFVIAGGDGTVRKVVEELLKRKKTLKIPPITILPHGTANNIATTLKITGKTKRIIASWRHGIIRKIDFGKIRNVPPAKFFIEGCGFGIFPRMILHLIKQGEMLPPEERLKKDHEVLYKTIMSYKAIDCKLKVDKTNHSGKFILVEIMNTKAVGPGLFLSPLGDPGDGELEVIMIPAEHRKKLAAYIQDKMNGKETTYQFHTLKAKNVSIKCGSRDIHVDDEILKTKPSTKVKININTGALDFLVPQ
jgi:diacylglycerol kinase family enzyme